MANDTHIQSLVAMGLNALEAEVYTHLLKQSPLTGYGVAKALGKAAANVYKAIDTLAEKGAVIVDDGATRQCRAVPAKDFLERLQRDFVRNRTEAEAVLSRLPGPGEDTRVYQLRSRSQVFEQCRQMLATAEHSARIDIFAEPLVELRPEIEAAVERGLSVVVKTYKPAEIPGAEVVVDPDAALTLDRWPGQWIDLVTDGSRFTMALLTSDGSEVVQAVWSASPHVAYIHHNRMACEMAYTAIKIDIESDAGRDEILRTYARTQEYFALDNPGYERLLKQIGRFQTMMKETKP